MNKKEAIKILRLKGTESKEEIRKQYRTLMKQAHPDMLSSGMGDDALKEAASLINVAYETLKDGNLSKVGGKEKSKSDSACKINAPENKNAFAERDVYSYVEDAEGRNIGDFVIGHGKYVWQVEEDFSLFLKSVYKLSTELLNKCEDENPKTVLMDERESFEQKLFFLLSQQFVDGFYTLNKLSEAIEENVYYIPSMLEKTPGARVREGENLFPAYVKNHRLYLNNIEGTVVGYVSFKDDRFYYSVIPLFEQRRAMVKSKVGKIQPRFTSLDLWIKLDLSKAGFPESLNLSIENLLKEFTTGDRSLW